MRRSLAFAAMLGLVVVAAGCGGGDDDVTAEEAAPGSSVCEPVEVPEAREDGGAVKPSGRLAAGATYTLTFSTNCGDFAVTLDQALAPETAASLVALARSGFYDGTVIHRIVPGFVIQGGDPTGSGAGGPGYRTVDPPPATAAYTNGVVAMAKSQAEAPGTAGSQFFVITGEDAGLPPEYAILGAVTKGLEVVDAIGKLGDPATERPTEPVVVRTAVVTVDEG
jgi:cyclophilin family peptidyl-prolyl cis-trans isomerase